METWNLVVFGLFLVVWCLFFFVLKPRLCEECRKKADCIFMMGFSSLVIILSALNVNGHPLWLNAILFVYGAYLIIRNSMKLDKLMEETA